MLTDVAAWAISMVIAALLLVAAPRVTVVALCAPIWAILLLAAVLTWPIDAVGAFIERRR